MLYVIIGIIAVSLAVYSMIGISMSGMPKGKKMVWFAIVALIPIIGPLCYYIARPNRVLQTKNEY